MIILRRLPILAACAAAAWSALAQDDYLDADLRARVEALKADVAALPSNRANAAGRARTLKDWINAYALAGHYVPVNATSVVSGVLAYPERANRVAALDPMFAELGVLDEHPGALGTLTATTGPYTVRTFATIEQTYTVGAKDVEPGGGFIVARQFMANFGPFQTEDETADNYIAIASSNPNARFSRSALPMSGMHGGFRSAADALVFRLTSGRLTAGDTVTITYGDTTAGGQGLLMPSFSSDRMPLPLYVDFDGSDLPVSLPIQPIVVVGGEVAGVHGFAPSVVAVGETFKLTVRAEDRYYNRATGPKPGWQVLANGEPFAVLSSGDSLAIFSSARFDAPGVYRFEIRSLDGAITGVANPVLVEESPARRIYWGDTHGHSGFAEGVGTPDRFMTWARDDAGLDYVTHSEHDIWMDDFEWEVLKDNVRRYSEDGSFVAFLGYEWTIQNTQGGHHNVLFRTPDGRRRIPAQEFGTLTKLYQGLRAHHAPEDVVVIPHAHQAGNYRQSDPDLEPLIEIMSQHGTFEWFGRMYLRQGHQVGFIAASDNHLSQPGYSAPQNGSLSQRGGLGALRATTGTRDALFDAMRDRATYATTGDRIILDVTVNGAEMGSRAPFAEERRIVGRVVGTAPIESIAVVKNDGEIIWHRDYLTDTATRSVTGGEFMLSFASPSLPYHPGDNPRGWRWWWGTIELDGAVAKEAHALSGDNLAGHQLDITDGSSIAFRTHTRGGTSTLKLVLDDVRRPATLTVKLREGREFGGGPPRFRWHKEVPAAEVVLPLREMQRGTLTRTIDFDGYADTVTLRRIVAEGERDVEFAVDDQGRRQGDYYYVRVVQTNDAQAWSSPVWVGGYPSR